jgi:hypothetical protein
VFAYSLLGTGTGSDELRFDVPGSLTRLSRDKTIAAGVVGGILFFIAAIVLSVCMVKLCNERKRRKAEKGKSNRHLRRRSTFFCYIQTSDISLGFVQFLRHRSSNSLSLCLQEWSRSTAEFDSIHATLIDSFVKRFASIRIKDEPVMQSTLQKDSAFFRPAFYVNKILLFFCQKK